MVELFCTNIGVAKSASGVYIDESVSASALKKTIKLKISDDPILKKAAAKNLQLFLAEKEDGWLLDVDTLDAVLHSGDDTSCVKMRVSWMLNKPRLFGPNVSMC